MREASKLEAPQSEILPNDTILIVVRTICVNVRSLRYVASKLVAIELLLSFSRYLSDKYKLHVVLP